MRLLEDTRIVFTTAIIVSLLYPTHASSLQWTIIPALIVAMTLSLRGLGLEGFKRKSVFPSALKAMILHYVLLNCLILSAAYLLVADTDYLAGFIIIAAVPPAISVVPFTYLLRGDSYTSTVAEALSYMLSLAYTPLLIYLLLGGVADVNYLLQLMAVLIILPMLLSRVFRRIDSPLWEHSKSVVTLVFALITYVLVGLNHTAITSEPLLLLPVVVVILLRTFVSGTVVYYISRSLGAGNRAVSYALFSSYKNNGAAAVIALALLNPAAALPMAFAAIAEPTYIILLQHIRGSE